MNKQLVGKLFVGVGVGCHGKRWSASLIIKKILSVRLAKIKRLTLPSITQNMEVVGTLKSCWQENKMIEHFWRPMLVY